MKITLSVLKADVGSIGGHTKPSKRMLDAVRHLIRDAKSQGLVIDAMVTHTGDDIAITVSHVHGKNAPEIHKMAGQAFMEATRVAKRYGLYGAGQDLLKDALSGNLRGAGPAVAEIEFDPEKSADVHKRAEAFLLYFADKCGPGAYNLPLYLNFCDPMHNGGLLLSPPLAKGFTLEIIDMEHVDGDRLIRLDAPERIWDAAVLLRDIDRFAVENVWSRHDPEEQIVAVSATRLHNISGVYSGKDDPVMIMRTQKIFPAPEEALHPWKIGHKVTGDCRGSHVMHISPQPIDTAVTDSYCEPIVACLALSMTPDGAFSDEVVDLFAGRGWDETRRKVSLKNEEARREGFFGYNMASKAELAYTGLAEAEARLGKEFFIRK
jgi:fructose 1,6-bisphosphate aldolase/phosphatase